MAEEAERNGLRRGGGQPGVDPRDGHWKGKRDGVEYGDEGCQERGGG